MTRLLTCVLGCLLVSLCACQKSKPDAYFNDPNHEDCVDGELGACTAFAQKNSDGTVANRRAALIAYRYACHQGDADACTELAIALGDTQAKQRQILTALEKGCEGGNAEACVKFGDSLPPYQATDYYQRACDGSNGDGCWHVAMQVRDLWRIESKLQLAFDLESKGCEMGSANACAAAGQALLFGSGIEQDTARGLKLLTDTCTPKVGVGCLRLARMYETGIGVGQDLAKANEYYETASLHNAEPVANSAATAYVVYVDGCNQGDALGCYNAGFALAEGIDVPRNITTSREFFQQACDEGLDTACDKWSSIKPAKEVLRSSQ